MCKVTKMPTARQYCDGCMVMGLVGRHIALLADVTQQRIASKPQAHNTPHRCFNTHLMMYLVTFSCCVLVTSGRVNAARKIVGRNGNRVAITSTSLVTHRRYMEEKRYMKTLLVIQNTKELVQSKNKAKRPQFTYAVRSVQFLYISPVSTRHWHCSRHRL